MLELLTARVAVQFPPASVTSILVTLGSQVGSEWSSVGDRTQEAKKEVQEPGSEALADEH